MENIPIPYQLYIEANNRSDSGIGVVRINRINRMTISFKYLLILLKPETSWINNSILSGSQLKLISDIFVI